MKNDKFGATVPEKKGCANATHWGIEEHATIIWHTTELLRNQHSEDGESVTISRGALQRCCKAIDFHLSEITELVDTPAKQFKVPQ